MSMPVVLFYNLETPKGRQIKLLCLPLKLRVKSVEPGEYGETLAALAGLEEKQEIRTEESFSDEMLLMCGLSDGQLNGLLQGIRKKKLGSVALKAVMTETNCHWNSIELHRELQKEYEAMQMGNTAHR